MDTVSPLDSSLAWHSGEPGQVWITIWYMNSYYLEKCNHNNQFLDGLSWPFHL